MSFKAELILEKLITKISKGKYEKKKQVNNFDNRLEKIGQWENLQKKREDEERIKDERIMEEIRKKFELKELKEIGKS